MKIKIHFYITLLLAACTAPNPPVIPSGAKIYTRYKTLDEHLSPEIVNCNDSLYPFIEIKEWSCSFLLGEMEFDIEQEVRLDTNANVIYDAEFLPEGPVVYFASDLANDTLFGQAVGLQGFSLEILPDRTGVVDCGDTLYIEKIFEKEKVLLMKQTPKQATNGRRVLYVYSFSTPAYRYKADE